MLGNIEISFAWPNFTLQIFTLYSIFSKSTHQCKKLFQKNSSAFIKKANEWSIFLVRWWRWSWGGWWMPPSACWRLWFWWWRASAFCSCWNKLKFLLSVYWSMYNIHIIGLFCLDSICNITCSSSKSSWGSTGTSNWWAWPWSPSTYHESHVSYFSMVWWDYA